MGSREGLSRWLCLGPVAMAAVLVGLGAFSSFSLSGSPGSPLLAIWCILVLTSLEENHPNFQLQQQDTNLISATLVADISPSVGLARERQRRAW